MSNCGESRASGAVVYAPDARFADKAAALAARLDVPCMPSDELPKPEGELVLRVDADGLALEQGRMRLRGDYGRLVPRLAPGKLQRELLVKAARIKGSTGPLRALDATAGLGEDALLLAAAGFEVKLCERNPVIAALLADTLQRAALLPKLADVVARMQLVEGDSMVELAAMAARGEACDVVVLDPMFPEKGHAAATKKKLQLLQALEQPCEDEVALLDAALRIRPRKVVVKRPAKGPFLAGRKPSYSLPGTTIRYDCYLGVSVL